MGGSVTATSTRQQRPSRIEDWFDEASIEEPNPSAPDQVALARRRRRWRVFVWACVLLMPLTLVALLSEAARPAAKSAPSHAGFAATSPGEVAAFEEIYSWLAGSPSPLPGGRVVSWIGASKLAPVKVPPADLRAPPGASVESPGPATPTEIDRFVLQSGTGDYYEADVEVAYSAAAGAVALGGPSLEPIPAPSASFAAQASPWPGLTASSSVPGAVSQAVSSWVTAYTSGSSTTLRFSVGDPNPRDSYVSLSGVARASASVIAATPLGGPSSGRMAVEVTLSILWRGERVPPGGGLTASSPMTTMDLLVERANTAAPVVVAWGPAGSGPTLRPYANAVSSGRSRAAHSATPPSSTTTTSSTAAKAPRRAAKTQKHLPKTA